MLSLIFLVANDVSCLSMSVLCVPHSMECLFMPSVHFLIELDIKKIMLLLRFAIYLFVLDTSPNQICGL